MTLKQERMADRIREILSSLLLLEVTDPALQGVTVVEVRLDQELEYADVYVNALGDESRQSEVMAGCVGPMASYGAKSASASSCGGLPRCVSIGILR